MKILHIASSGIHGRGGHNYDAKTLSEMYSEYNTIGDVCSLVCIGAPCFSPIIKSSYLDKYFIKVTPLNLFKALFTFIKIVKVNFYDVLQAYDSLSYTFASIAGSLLKKKVLFVKCGGANARKFIYVDNLMVFSKENYMFFKKNDKFRNTNIFFIPNRVSNEILARQKMRNYTKALSTYNQKKVLLRISRIGSCYGPNLIKTIKEVKNLLFLISNLKFVIIGAVESEKWERILSGEIKRINMQAKREAMIMLTSDRYTIDASKYIDIADFVIATGRGTMEAMAKGKPVFVPFKNGDLILVTPENTDRLFYYNFSGRTSNPFLKTYKDYSIQKTIKQLMTDETYLNIIKEFYLDYFKKNLEVKNVISCYQTLYRENLLSGKSIRFYSGAFYSFLSTYKNLAKNYFDNIIPIRLKKEKHD